MADKINENNLNKVSGGGFFSEFTDEQYNRAGVKVNGSGALWNDSYSFKGQKITTEEASFLVYFYEEFGRQAESVKEANDWRNSYWNK